MVSSDCLLLRWMRNWMKSNNTASRYAQSFVWTNHVQKSFEYFLEVCIAVTKKLHDDMADPKESFYYAILASSMLFE